MGGRGDVLLLIAKRLPLPALVKFAQASSAANYAAREAWETWQQGCYDAGICRMFSDKCWMDAYTRTLRQHSFRFVDAAALWVRIQEPPAWLAEALHGHCSIKLKKASFQFCVRRDYEVINMVCMRGRDVWATISSTGEYWQFTDAFPCLDASECRAISAFLKQIGELLHQRKVTAKSSNDRLPGIRARKHTVAVAGRKVAEKLPAKSKKKLASTAAALRLAALQKC